MKGLDLRTRLLAAIGLVGLLQIVVAFVVISATRDQLVDQIDERLAIAAEPGPNLDVERDRDDRPEPPDGSSPAGDERDRPERLGDTYLGVLSPDGTLFTFFAPNSTGTELPPPEIAIPQAESSGGRPITVDVANDELHYRLTATGPLDDGDYFISAIPLEGVDATMSQLTTVVALTAAAITLVLVLVTWWVLRLGIAPIKRMTATAEAIAAGQLSQRITDVDQNTEAGQLGHALNSMLGRIETSFAERVRAEDKLRQFIADASHELRTPVATIRGYTELYRVGGLEDRSELDDAMRRTEQESERMSRLIADMLNLAKLDRDPSIVTQPVDLAALVSDAVTDAQVTHPDRVISATVPNETLTVEGDEDLLRQVLANLVTNAVVHTDPSATVSVSARSTAQTATVEVSDDGDGMPPDVSARVTERFFRADPSRSRHRGGSGLGLAIADSVISAHHGTLRVDSTPGDGTSVTLTIPLGPHA